MNGAAGTATPHQQPAGSRPLQVLVVMPLGTALGGGEEMLRQLLREGRGRGVSWAVVFLRPGPLVDDVRALGIEYHVVDAGRMRHISRRLGAVRRIADLARNADLVFGWMVAGQAMAGPSALLAGRPCAWYQVGTPRPDFLDRFATIWPTRGVIALSRAGAEAQSRIWPRRRVTLVPPGVARGRVEAARALAPAELRRRFSLPAHGPLVGTVGRLQRWKGMHVFLDALAELRRTHDTVHGVIVGGPHETEPRYVDELRAQAAALGIADAVTFAGFQANAIEWMQAMDVFVHAAEREPFGIVVVEAMALGKPVVAGAEGGPAEVITDGIDGLLTSYGNAGTLARTMARFLDDPAFAARAGAAARVRAAAFGEASYAANVVRAILEFAAR